MTAALSALFLNDTVCLMLTVPVLVIVRRRGLPAAPYLVALATSANIGSVMTEVGNPQNMLIANYSQLSYAAFFAWMAPVGLVSMAVLVGLLLWAYRGQLREVSAPAGLAEANVARPYVDRALLVKSLVVLVGVLVGFVAIGQLPLVAMTGAVVLLLVARRPMGEVLARVDWILLAFFAGLFIVVRGLERTGLVAEFAAAVSPVVRLDAGDASADVQPGDGDCQQRGVERAVCDPARETVPTLVEPQLMWLVLAMASTLAGNLTIPGSVATLIVLETARRHEPAGSPHVGFVEFLRVGLPVTLLTVALGAAILLAEHWLVAQLR